MHTTKAHAPASTGAIAQQRSRVLRAIKGHTKGHEITAPDIARACGIDEANWTTCTNTRNVIRSLVEEGYPICANSRGHYMPRNEEELEEYIENLYSRADSIHRRIFAIIRHHLEV